MAGKDVSYQFLDALAKSVGMGAETVKQALAEINQLQGKALTNHASQQPVFGAANEQMYGHGKIAHEVTDDSTDGAAVSPDAAYAYAPNRNATPIAPIPAGTVVALAPPDTTPFSSYSAYGTIIEKDGIYYTASAICIRCACDDWDQRPQITNSALSFKAFVQFSSNLIDACAITNGVASYPKSGSASVTFLLPPYLAFTD